MIILLLHRFAKTHNVQIDGAAAADNDYIMMTLRETFWTTRLLTSVTNSNKDHPWIYSEIYGIFNALYRKIQIYACTISVTEIRYRK